VRGQKKRRSLGRDTQKSYNTGEKEKKGIKKSRLVTAPDFRKSGTKGGG